MLVDIQRRLFAVGKQARLVGLSACLKAGDGLGGGDAAAAQRNILGNDALDLLPQGVRREIGRTRDLDVEAGTDGAGHLGPCRGPQPPQSKEQDELRRAHIGVPSGGIGVTQQLDVAVRRRHGATDGAPFPADLLVPLGDVVEGKDAPRDEGGQRVGGEFAVEQAHAMDDVVQGLVGICRDGTAVDGQLHEVTSFVWGWADASEAGGRRRRRMI